MLNEFKGDLVDVVCSAADVLSDEDALEIMGICKRALDREIADVTEQYLKESILSGKEVDDG